MLCRGHELSHKSRHRVNAKLLIHFPFVSNHPFMKEIILVENPRLMSWMRSKFKVTWSWSKILSTNSLCFMSICTFISEIQVYQNLTLKIKGQSKNGKSGCYFIAWTICLLLCWQFETDPYHMIPKNGIQKPLISANWHPTGWLNLA